MINGGVAGYWLNVVILASIAIGLRHEGLESGFFADDYAQLGMLSGHYPVPRSKLDLFTFSDGTRREGEQLIRSGFYPWFSEPTVRISMFRPLASAMTWLEYRLFERAPLGYHVVSVVAWCVMFGTIAWLYRRLLPTRIALLALTLFAASVAQCVVISWIANCCAIVGVLFAALGLIFYVGRTQEESAPSWLVASCFALSFGFGEYALCALGYVLAYEWVHGSSGVAVRIRRLWPIALPALVYLAVRGAYHYTPRGSGVYVDPVSDPRAFLWATLLRVPILSADMLLGLRGEYWTFGFDPWFYRLLDPSWLPGNWFDRLETWRATHVALGVLACALFGWILCWVWRWSDISHLRWLGVGSALSVFPVVASFPSSRLLLVPLLGFCPLVAALFFRGLGRARTLLTGGARTRGAMLATTAVAACTYSLLMGLWLTRDQMLGIEAGSRQQRNAVLNLEADELLPQQHIVLLTAAEGNTSMYIPLTRWVYDRPVPKSCHTLSLVPSAYALKRVAPNAFTIDYYKPSALLRTAPEQLLRGSQSPLRIDDVIDAGLFRVMILALRNGLPQRLLVRFEVPLEHPTLRFMASTREGIRVFELPAIGATVAMPAPTVPDE